MFLENRGCGGAQVPVRIGVVGVYHPYHPGVSRDEFSFSEERVLVPEGLEWRGGDRIVFARGLNSFVCEGT